jgi:L-fuconolactonase
MLKVDTHLHSWNLSQVDYYWLQPEYKAFYGNFTPDVVEPQIKKVGIDRAVLVQAADSYEDTASMLVHADYREWIGGVVGWCNLLNPDETRRRLDIYSKSPWYKGVRHLIHTESNPDWIVQDKVIESLNILAEYGMTFDLVAVFPNHLKHAPTLVKRVPKLKIAIDHLAKPPIGEKKSPWFDQMKAAAESPNVFTKLSGQFDNPAWTVDDVKPYFDFAFQQFGADRIMFGSDWPIARLGGTYFTVWHNVQKLLEGRSEAEKDAVLGGTAAKFYSVT